MRAPYTDLANRVKQILFVAHVHCHCAFTPAIAALPPSAWLAKASHPRLVTRRAKQTEQRKTWMAGTSPAMTMGEGRGFIHGGSVRRPV